HALAPLRRLGARDEVAEDAAEPPQRGGRPRPAGVVGVGGAPAGTRDETARRERDEDADVGAEVGDVAALLPRRPAVHGGGGLGAVDEDGPGQGGVGGGLVEAELAAPLVVDLGPRVPAVGRALGTVARGDEGIGTEPEEGGVDGLLAPE